MKTPDSRIAMTGSALSGLISDKLKLRKTVIIAGSIICACAWGLIVRIHR